MNDYAPLYKELYFSDTVLTPYNTPMAVVITNDQVRAAQRCCLCT